MCVRRMEAYASGNGGTLPYAHYVEFATHMFLCTFVFRPCAPVCREYARVWEPSRA